VISFLSLSSKAPANAGTPKSEGKGIIARYDRDRTTMMTVQAASSNVGYPKRAKRTEKRCIVRCFVVLFAEARIIQQFQQVSSSRRILFASKCNEFVSVEAIVEAMRSWHDIDIINVHGAIFVKTENDGRDKRPTIEEGVR